MEEYQQIHRFSENKDVAEEARRVANNVETLFPTRICFTTVIDEVVEREGRSILRVGVRLIDESYALVEYDPTKKGEFYVETRGPPVNWVKKVLAIRDSYIEVMARQRDFSSLSSLSEDPLPDMSQ